MLTELPAHNSQCWYFLPKWQSMLEAFSFFEVNISRLYFTQWITRYKSYLPVIKIIYLTMNILYRNYFSVRESSCAVTSPLKIVSCSFFCKKTASRFPSWSLFWEYEYGTSNLLSGLRKTWEESWSMSDLIHWLELTVLESMNL